jgi:hypothetical protein
MLPCTLRGTDQFVTPEFIAYHDIDAGEEVFMTGRFVGLQGKRDNAVATRFGCISMMRGGRWNKAIGKDQEGFAVEMRSRTGFSGSPVFVYGHPTMTIKYRAADRNHFFALLGANWGYVLDSEVNHAGERENTWLNGVVPAWKISELLERPALKHYHEEQEARILAYLKKGKRLGSERACSKR